MQWLINEFLVTNDVVPNMVTRVIFSVQDTQNGVTGQVTHGIDLEPANPRDYTKYERITESQAIDWIQAILGVLGMDRMQDEVQAIIDQQKVVIPEAKLLPWQTL
jgi:hypothetical protein